MLSRLPLDLSSFRTLRNEGYVYVDKTKYAYDLIMQGRRYFLSRPRRFGKSLFVSMLKEMLTGKKELFHDLWIARSDYQFKKHGVIVLNLSTLGIEDVGTFKRGICYVLDEIAHDYKVTVTLDKESPELALRGLVKALRQEYNNVAILIDEYDYPILQSLKNVDKAKQIRDAIRNFFSSIKGLDEEVDFVFITGVSSFAKAGLFSGMNNMRIITLDENFSSICGYDETEIDRYFTEYIQAWVASTDTSYDEIRKQIREWYNGYRFAGNAPTVYNPFSLMNAVHAKDFKNFWFSTGTTTFLVEELTKEYRKSEHHILDLEAFQITEDSLGIFEIGATPLPALLFQTGYLTIASFDRKNRSYTLKYPNFEVKTSMQKNLLGIFTDMNSTETEQFSFKLIAALNHKKIDEAIALIKQIFVRVPYQLHGNENFYHALLQAIFGACDIKSQSEIVTSHGRIDIVLELPSLLYVIEVKLNASAAVALAQIEERKYYESLVYHGKPIVLLGIAFERKPKTFEITYATKLKDTLT
jgi:predicted AAA-ATPase/PD-(D/E)XK nuclease superfamily protein